MREKLRKSILIRVIILVFTICISFILNLQVKKAEFDFKIVDVMVVKVEKDYPKKVGEVFKYKITVSHNGEKKDLQNVKMGFSYYESQQIQVYESNGNLYEDIDGVISNTMPAYFYFGSLIFVLIAVFLLVLKIVEYRREG